MTSFNGRHILITGAASGIGRLLAHEAAARGAFVLAWDINAAGLETLAVELPGKVATTAVDMSQRTAVQAAAAQTLADHGRVDILVNNAGVVQGKSILDCDDAAIERTFAVNTLAHFWTVRAFLPGMIRRGHGHIVTVASASGLVGVPGLSDYAASKAAALSFDDSLRLEFARHKLPIRTTAVAPYYINTGMFDGVQTRFPWLLPILDPDDVVRGIVRAIERDDQRLIMPPFVYATYAARLLPLGLFDWLMRYFGISNSMDDFVGRGEKAATAAPPPDRGPAPESPRGT